MWILVQALFFYSLYTFCASYDIPEVELYMKHSNGSNGIECTLVSHKLAFKQTYKLSVKTDRDDKRVYTGSCNFTTPQSVSTRSLRKTSNDAYTLDNVSAVARSLSCSLHELPYNGKDSNTLHCVNLSVDIRDPSMGILKLTVAGEEIKTTPASNTDSYDAYATYHYKRGELANITCTINNANILRLLYKDKKGHVDKTSYKVLAVNMLKKMPVDNNGAYVECIISDIDGIKSYIVRVNLEEKKTFDEYDIGFIVNDLPLSPVQRYINNTIYQYHYYDGEQLKIQSFNWNAYMECKGENIPDDLKSYKTSWKAKNINITTVLQEYIKTMSISCSTMTSANRKTVTINLIPNYFDYSPFIKGLSRAKFLSKTFASANKTDLTTINYDYEGQHLYLRCYSKTASPRWSFSSHVQNISETPSFYSVHSNYYVIKATFKLEAREQAGEINCTSIVVNCAVTNKSPCMEYVDVVQIILKHTDMTASIRPSTNDDKGTLNKEMKIMKPGRVRTIDSKYIYMAAGVGALVTIMILSCFLMTITKRKPRPDPSAMSYENLPENNEGPIAMTSQWNEAQYAVPSDAYNDSIYAQPSNSSPEILYSKPTAKNHRPQINEEPGYATVDVGPTYAQVLPKSMRFGHQNAVQVLPTGVNMATNGKFKTKTNKPSSKTPSESPYAEMGHVIDSYANSSCSENPYAHVSTGNPYAEPYSGNEKSSNYSNIFDNARYINSNPNADYVEPTYCDLDKQK